MPPALGTSPMPIAGSPSILPSTAPATALSATLWLLIPLACPESECSRLPVYLSPSARPLRPVITRSSLSVGIMGPAPKLDWWLLAQLQGAVGRPARQIV